MTDAFVHDAGFQEALVDGVADAADTANAIDGTEVVFMSGLDGAAAVEIDAEAGTEHGALDVVGGESIAGEEDIKIAATDESGEMLDASGVDDGRTAHDSGLPSGTVGLEELTGDFANDDGLWLFGGDGTVHKFESVVLDLALLRKDADARVPDDDPHAGFDIEHGNTSGGTAIRIDDDAAVHLLTIDISPFSVETNLSALVGRTVEGFGEGAGDVGDDERTIDERSRDSAVVADLGEEEVKLFAGIGADFE